ncbi:GIN domain-containing protein [Flavilitoribacter nigricans]|uniref:Putative auto-transporter adhesin head GIN domain-containing protein n=1 Tax=Flavilitoribacter nigricans (strain ATCC 23147 / DSM 23189 / NBRC 102662 / NCIMB 1420 / SS-2) TaxID=1122177 RepID=A0A2D0N5P3_FLAN2|nr:DUF2807 domain-containing protein [Flavilitoribacter nigricans]PHN03718.1 hypothetical protein CRP01_24500 [Flavilitoribacter nigricans DSM 23189 = NBRC 102662]
MKSSYLLFVIGTILFLGSGCDNADDFMLPMEFAVEPYSKIKIDGQVKIFFNKETGPDEYYVEITSTEEQRKDITIVNEDGVLTITVGEDVVFEDEVTINLNALEIDEIRLQSNQKAELIGFFDQENLRVVTEGFSELKLACLRVDNLVSVQEAESTFHLENWFEVIEEALIIPEENAVMVNDTTLLVDDSSLIIGESIALEGTGPLNWTVYGDFIKRYYFISQADFKTEGKTYLNALFAPVVDLNIKLEGTSEAMVWAIDRLSGKGEGESLLWYRGDPDLSEFRTQGAAQVLPMY